MAKKFGDFKSLRFPQEVSTNEVPNYIRFEPKKFKFGGTLSSSDRSHSPSVTAPQYSAPRTNSASQGSGAWDLSASIDGLSKSITNTVNGLVQGLSSGFGFDLPLDKTFGVLGKFNLDPTKLTEQVKTQPDSVQSQGSINLYMPKEIYAKTSLNYGAEELGTVGVKVAKNASVEGITNAMPEALGQKLKDFANDQAIVKAFEVGQGITANNYSYQIFNGVNHREFSYSFQLVPRNEKDSLDIKEICDTFKYWALPSRTTRYDLLYYEVPAIWEITYMKGSSEIQFLDSPKECFLQSIEVSYGANSSMKLFEDGAPMEVTLTMSFVEIEPEYRI